MGWPCKLPMTVTSGAPEVLSAPTNWPASSDPMNRRMTPFSSWNEKRRSRPRSETSTSDCVFPPLRHLANQFLEALGQVEVEHRAIGVTEAPVAADAGRHDPQIGRAG